MGEDREARLRRKAGGQGLTLRRSRSRDSEARDFGSYWLVATNLNAVLGGEWGVDLDAVEEFLGDEGDEEAEQQPA